MYITGVDTHAQHHTTAHTQTHIHFLILCISTQESPKVTRRCQVGRDITALCHKGDSANTHTHLCSCLELALRLLALKNSASDQHSV